MANKTNNSINKKNIRLLIVSFSSVVIIVAGFFFFSYVFSGLPSLDQLENPKQSLASNVFSTDGELIGQFFIENRIETNLDSLPHTLIDALVATEDRKYYDHWGVDLERFVKAMLKNVFLLKREGASTITQQLAKNLYELKIQEESLFDTGVRKIREWITSVQIEQNYTKTEILEMYFNESFFGNSAYGIEMAARVYFDKEARYLTVPESALLVGILKSWVYYNPYKRYNDALRRRNLVMYNMVDAGYLSREEYDKFKIEPIKLSFEKVTKGFSGDTAPHFIEYIRRQLEKMSEKYGYNLYEDGLSIYTTLDKRIQDIAAAAAARHLSEFQKQFDQYWKWTRNKKLLDELVETAIKNRFEYIRAKTKTEKKSVFQKLSTDEKFIDSVKNNAQKIEVGFVVLDVKTGEIRAMVGGREHSLGRGLNHVTQIKRQPGSAFKPIIYSAAIDNGLYPAYPMLNQRFSYPAGDGKIWSPQNFDRTTGGFIALRDALKESLNIISARLIIEDHAPLWKIGLFAHSMGIKSKIDLVPAIALGVAEVSPLELTNVYATIANKGVYNEPISILRIEDKNGILIESFSSSTKEAISEETAYIMTDMMTSVVNEGTALRVRTSHQFSRPAAGKTGTTQDYADAWFVGFTPQFAGGVWVGFDDRRVTFTGSYGQGAKAALPVWGYFMKELYDTIDFPLEYFTAPESGNVVSVNFCRESIYEYGDPRLSSGDCRTGTLTDLINLKDIPLPFNASRDARVKIDHKFDYVDSLANEAAEIR